MFPILIGEGAWALPSFFAMFMLGFVVAAGLARAEGVRLGLDVARVVDMTLAGWGAGVAGARLFHVLFDGHLQDYMHLCFDPAALGLPLPDGSACVSDEACAAAQSKGLDIGGLCDAAKGLCVPARDCLRTLKFWTGGLVWYGGFLLATGVMALWTRRFFGGRGRALAMADMLSPSVAVGLAIGRVGCFLSGCCFGSVCPTQPPGVRFPRWSDAWDLHLKEHRAELIQQHAETGVWESLPVHPTQLYEAGGLLLILGFLWWGPRLRKRSDGQVLGWLLALYGVLRFVIEFWRADERGGWLLSTSQWISAPLVVVGVWLIVRRGGLTPLRDEAEVQGAQGAQGEADAP
jgi:phosphatidylglycerol:prolipoprotein diacylglycerol transferase